MGKIQAFFVKIGNNVWFSVKTCFLASRFYFSMKLLILLSTTAVPLVNLRLWREVLNGIAERKAEPVTICLAVYLLLQLTACLLKKFDAYVGSRYRDELQFYIETVMMEKTSRMDLAFFDSAEMGDKVSHARSNFSVMRLMAWQVFQILSACINVIATLILVSSYHWWLGIATILLLIPYFFYYKRYNEQHLCREKEQIRDRRKMEYYRNAFLDSNVQFEVKLNHIGETFLHRYKELWQKLHRINQRETIRHNLRLLCLTLLHAAAEILVLTVSVADLIGRAIGIGDLPYNIGLVSRLRAQSGELMLQMNRFLDNDTRLTELQEFLSIVPQAEKSGSKIPSAHPRITFSHVSFRYPNAEQYVLKDCSFTIEPHEKVGLIGLNGAGKSTIIKLLFRFYDPEDGIIQLDGVDLREYDVYAVRRVFGVLFQDFVTYCLPLREIIALSDFDSRFDDKKLRQACDVSGAAAIIRDWEDGFDSVLGRYYADNGKDLSGGQWQLICLARAYFRETGCMVLDEPSAALDPISEDRIFEQLYRLSQGKGSVTISHRLSNTTLADKILVLDEGRILEQGSHAELLRQNGKYAHLFRLQASKYE